jgi:two-component system cell cycle response regulator
MDDEGKIRKKILIAEDDPVSRHMLMAFLVKWDYEVVAAADGIEALRILESEGAPPLAVLDWMMPGLEGPQVCQRVREQSGRPYVYVLLLTARSQKGDLLRGLESGADDYLTKPFDAQELRARLRVGQRILDLQDSLIAAREELRFSATHDALTGISNRASIFEAVSREQSRQAREGGSFGVIFADIDHFKMINDRHGHHSGDVVLREVTQRMMGCSRPYDTLGRYGGEEFLIVAPSSDGLGTLALAERIRQAIESEPISTNAGVVRVTASFGVAVSGHAKPLESDALLRLADEALYRAKNHGRNRSELATETEAARADPTADETASLDSGSR